MTKSILRCLNFRLKTGYQAARGFLPTCVSKDYRQGLLIERTPYKDTVYVWAAVFPVFTVSQVESLDFSFRIDGGRFFEGDAKEISSNIIEAVQRTAELEKRLFQPMCHFDFVEIEPKIRRYPQNFPASTVCDVAYALSQLRSFEDARRLMHFLRSSGRACGLPVLKARVDDVLREIKDF